MRLTNIVRVLECFYNNLIKGHRKVIIEQNKICEYQLCFIHRQKRNDHYGIIHSFLYFYRRNERTQILGIT